MATDNRLWKEKENRKIASREECFRIFRSTLLEGGHARGIVLWFKTFKKEENNHLQHHSRFTATLGGCALNRDKKRGFFQLTPQQLVR